MASWLQSFVDESPRPGRFFLTGSNQPLLRSHISQSLAGRAAYIDLLPFCMKELKNGDRKEWSAAVEKLFWKGFYPPLYDRPFSLKSGIRSMFRPISKGMYLRSFR